MAACSSITGADDFFIGAPPLAADASERDQTSAEPSAPTPTPAETGVPRDAEAADSPTHDAAEDQDTGAPACQAEGQTCSGVTDCCAPLKCNELGRCVQTCIAPASSAVCTDGECCAGGRCTGFFTPKVCQPCALTGAACEAPAQCCSRACTASKCAAN